MVISRKHYFNYLIGRSLTGHYMNGHNFEWKLKYMLEGIHLINLI